MLRRLLDERRRTAATILSVALLLLTASAAAPTRLPPGGYTRVELAGLEGGTADAVNNRGQVAGTVPADGWFDVCASAVIWTGKGVQDIGVANTPACATVADLNDRGEVVGNLHEAHPYDAYQWRRGETTLLPGSGYIRYAAAVSDRGVVAGGYGDEGMGGGPRAMIWERGVGTELGTLEVPPDHWAHSYSAATGINDKHQVVGVSSTAEGSHAFLWERGTMTDLGTLGGTFSSAADINLHGVVVGTSTNEAGAAHAFLWSKGTMTDLGAWTPVAINHFGLVVGNRDGQVVVWSDGDLTTVAPGTAADLNDAGQIVGADSDGAPVMWQPAAP